MKKALIMGVSILLVSGSVGVAEALTPVEQNQLNQDFQRGPGPKYCPGFMGKTWNAKPEILGRKLKVARRITARHDCEIRVVRKDGEWLAGTADLRYFRLNVAVRGERQRITRVVDVG